MAPGLVAERSRLAPPDSEGPRRAFLAEDWRRSTSPGLLFLPASGSPEGRPLGAGLGQGCPSSGPAPALAQVRSWPLAPLGCISERLEPLFTSPAPAVNLLWSRDCPRYRTLPLDTDRFLHLVILV